MFDVNTGSRQKLLSFTSHPKYVKLALGAFRVRIVSYKTIRAKVIRLVSPYTVCVASFIEAHKIHYDVYSRYLITDSILAFSVAVKLEC